VPMFQSVCITCSLNPVIYKKNSLVFTCRTNADLLKVDSEQRPQAKQKKVGIKMSIRFAYELWFIEGGLHSRIG
jgi:hypothetical protein